VDEVVGGSCGTHGGEERILMGNLKERVCLEALALDGKIIFVCITKTEDLIEWTGFIWWRQENVVGSCVNGGTYVGCVRCVTFLD
jgi:hypothetical protein